MKQHLVFGFLFFQLFSSFPIFAAIETQPLFQRLAGRPLLKTDPRYSEIDALLKSGKALEAAEKISNDWGFFHITVRDWAAVMSNRSELPIVPLNDFLAMAIGVVRDRMDARSLLTGNFRYQANRGLRLVEPHFSNNDHYLALESNHADLQTALVKVEPQWTKGFKAAGLLTTRGWAEAHYVMGTNRRATEFAFREFLCAPIDQWRAGGLSDFWVRRDVDRKPGGNSDRYKSECRTCHAGLDGLTAAFAHFDFQAPTFYFSNNWIAPKYNQNKNVYPQGFATKDSTWINLLTTPAHQEMFGWRSPDEGVGINDFGALLANSRAFSECMVKRVFKKVCRQNLGPAQEDFLKAYSTQFEADHYDLRKLFERVAIAPTCYGE